MKTKLVKKIRGPDYNYNFYFKTGLFLRWGKTLKEDPVYSPLGPEMLDLEVSSICNGINGTPCSWCYKSNTPRGKNLSFDDFKKIFHKIPKNLMQIAFGIGDIDANKDFFKMLEYCRNNDYNQVVPNLTVNGWNLTKACVKEIARYCGAVAISNYDKELTYDAVKLFSDVINKNNNTLNQVNIHQLVANETFDACREVLKDYSRDSRLFKLHSIIFLALKKKGSRNTFHPLPMEKFKEIIEFALENDIPFGMDTCSAKKFLIAIKENPDFEKIKRFVEPCDSGMFSIYCNVVGKSSFCSFLEGEDFFEFDMLNCTNFMKDIWNHPEMNNWRNKLMNTAKNNDIGCYECLHYDI